MEFLYSYIFLVNLITFLIFGIDKRKARKNQWRISESTLLLFGLIGGSLGGLLAMNLFRHKTDKAKFTIVMPIFLIINILVLYFLVTKII